MTTRELFVFLAVLKYVYQIIEKQNMNFIRYDILRRTDFYNAVSAKHNLENGGYYKKNKT